MPMTRLVDDLLRKALTGSAGWQVATETHSIPENQSQDHPSR